ncbi:MAG: O-antigen ligase family protein [Chloroflexi bacterium]|nr:O-antigen ligase family protein [Chloroflexota bacterium]
MWLDSSTFAQQRWATLSLAAAAVLVGILLAELPVAWAAIGLVTVVLVGATLIEPLVGVGVVLVLGPTKPFTDFYVPALPLDLGQIALVITLGAWFLHAARRGKLTVPRSPLTVPLLIYVGTGLLSLLNALSLGYALTELIKWVQLLVMMWLVLLETRHDPSRLRLVVGLVLGAAAVQAAIGVWQFGLRDIGPEHYEILGGRFYRAYGSFEQPNPYGGFLGLTLPLALGITAGALERWIGPLLRRERDLREALNSDLLRLAGLSVLCALLLAALVMSWSRGAWLGFAVAAAGVLFAWPKRTWIGILLVIAGMLAVTVTLQFDLLPASLEARLTGFTQDFTTLDVRGVDINDTNYSVLERVAHWQAAWEMARYHPWLGVGIGNYEPVYPAFALLNWPQPLGHAHNIYLNTLAETGVIGLLAYVAFWAIVLWLTWRVTRSGESWRRFLAIGLFGTWVHLSAHSVLDKLYVANLHLHIGVLLGVVSVLALWEQE